MPFPPSPWFSEVGSRPPRPGTLAEIPCRHRRAIEIVETVLGCCDGSPAEIEVGDCFRGRHTTCGQLEGTLPCVDCGDREASA